MPSLNRIQRLSVGVLAGAALAVPASTASANDVWLWTCHGPAGQSIDLPPSGSSGVDGGFSHYGEGCGGQAANVGSGGYELSFTRPDPAAGSTAYMSFSAPVDTALKHVRVIRRLNGLSTTQAGNPQQYVLSTNGGQLEKIRLDAPPAWDGVVDRTFDATGGTSEAAKFTLSCDSASACPAATAPVSVDVSALALDVDDTASPTLAVGGYHSPVTCTSAPPSKVTCPGPGLDLNVDGRDVGVGLEHAEAWVDGTKMASAPYAASCQDLSPNDPQIDLPLNASCPSFASVKLHVDTSQIADGDHNLEVKVFDASGRSNTVPYVVPLSIDNHVNLGSDSQTLTIGTSSPTVLPGGGGTGGGGGVAGATATSCSSPKLSMFLSQKPLRVSHGVPVLQSGKRYRFRGRLTCVIKGKRQSAPKRTRIDLRNTVGKKTIIKGGTTVRDKGNITIILSYKSSRTLIFRYVNTDGKVSQVKIKIRVEKKKKKSSKS